MPRPAMFVEIVTAPSAPARATIAASSRIVLRVQHLARDAARAQPRGQPLRLRDGGRADQHRPAGGVRAPDLVDDRALLGRRDA